MPFVRLCQRNLQARLVLDDLGDCLNQCFDSVIVAETEQVKLGPMALRSPQMIVFVKLAISLLQQSVMRVTCRSLRFQKATEDIPYSIRFGRALGAAENPLHFPAIGAIEMALSIENNPLLSYCTLVPWAIKSAK